MTDRYNALIVVLNENIRSDDAQPLIDAIMQLKGVLSVEGHVGDCMSHISDRRARIDLINKLLTILHDNV